jgi:MoxR-like ATPase
MQKATLKVTIKEPLVRYIADLSAATRASQMTELGVSPRGSIAVSHMAKAAALMAGRDYVIEEDVRDVFTDVCSHRIILTQKARAAGSTQADILRQILGSVKLPYSV